MVLPPRTRAPRCLVPPPGRAGRDLPGRAMFTAFDLRRGCRGNPVGRGNH